MLSDVREGIAIVEGLAAPKDVLKVTACKLTPGGHFDTVWVGESVYGYTLCGGRVVLEDVCEAFLAIGGVMPLGGEYVGREGGRGGDASIDLNELRLGEERLSAGMCVENNRSEVMNVKDEVCRESGRGRRHR